MVVKSNRSVQVPSGFLLSYVLRKSLGIYGPQSLFFFSFSEIGLIRSREYFYED